MDYVIHLSHHMRFRNILCYNLFSSSGNRKFSSAFSDLHECAMCAHHLSVTIILFLRFSSPIIATPLDSHVRSPPNTYGGPTVQCFDSVVGSSHLSSVGPLAMDCYNAIGMFPYSRNPNTMIRFTNQDNLSGVHVPFTRSLRTCTVTLDLLPGIDNDGGTATWRTITSVAMQVVSSCVTETLMGGTGVVGSGSGLQVVVCGGAPAKGPGKPGIRRVCSDLAKKLVRISP